MKTLVREYNTVSDYTVDVLQRLHNKGRHHYVTGACTRRLFIGLLYSIGNVPMILFFSGLIQELETGRCYLKQPVSIQAVRRIFDLAKQYNSGTFNLCG